MFSRDRDFFLLSQPNKVPLGFRQKLKDKGKKSLRAKIFASGKPALVPLGFSRKLKDKGKKSLRVKIFASRKPALRHRQGAIRQRDENFRFSMSFIFNSFLFFSIVLFAFEICVALGNRVQSVYGPLHIKYCLPSSG